MNHSEISSFIWGTADLLRSSFKQHEYGEIILPFTVMRRLDVVLEPTKQAVLDVAARSLPAALRDTMPKRAAGVGFYNASEFTMRGLLSDADGIRENLTKYVTSFSPETADIFDKFKTFEVIKDPDDNDLPLLVVERFCSPLFTGAAGSGESEVRRYLLQHDLVDAIVAMPNDFFFSTGSATYIWVLDNTKEPRRRGTVQLINANGIYSKMRKSLGSKRNEFSDEQIAQIVVLYQAFEDANPKLSKVFDNDEFGYITVDVRRPRLDDDGKPVKTARGKLVPDKDLNDAENIPLAESVDEYVAREVLPYAPDAWIEPRKQKKGQLLELRDGGTVGYEIPFTRHFYEYTPLRPSAEILAEIRELEASIATKLEGVLQ